MLDHHTWPPRAQVLRYRGNSRNTACSALPPSIPPPTMSPSFMFLQKLKNNRKSTPVTSPPYSTGNAMPTTSTRKLRKPKSTYTNQNLSIPYKEEESDPKLSHQHHNHGSVSNPSIQVCRYVYSHGSFLTDQM